MQTGGLVLSCRSVALAGRRCGVQDTAASQGSDAGNRHHDNLPAALHGHVQACAGAGTQQPAKAAGCSSQVKGRGDCSRVSTFGDRSSRDMGAAPLPGVGRLGVPASQGRQWQFVEGEHGATTRKPRMGSSKGAIAWEGVPP